MGRLSTARAFIIDDGQTAGPTSFTARPYMKRLPFALVLTLLAPFTTLAQTPYLVKDINLTTNAHPQSSLPFDFFQYGSRVLFEATTNESGTELWSTDGTAGGTLQVADIYRGEESSSPTGFVLLNGNVVFNATDAARGQELWITNGTEAGTRLLADLRPGTPSSAPGSRVVYHGKLYFAADDGVDGSELWVTDGTPAGEEPCRASAERPRRVRSV